jgi:SAM-dependent methyltransferase
MSNSGIEFYEQNAERFFDDTVAVDMTALYDPFLAELPPGGLILDAGCGSARDSRAFLELGYQVHAFDASPRLAALASQHLGQPVDILRFDQVNWHARFDGIWACASLLHIPRAELPDILSRLARSLKPSGVLYASFKYGEGERWTHGRRFTDMDKPGLERLLKQTPHLALKTCWSSSDRRPNRADERWLNTLLTRQASG